MNHRFLLPTIPGAVVLVATACALVFAPEAAVLVDAAQGFPYVALLAALALSWRLKSTRLFAATSLLAILYVVLQPAWQGTDPLAHALIATSAPIGAAILAFANDREFSFARLRTHVLMTFAVPALIGFSVVGRTDGALRVLNTHLIDPVYTDWSQLPQPAFFAIVIAAAVTAVRFAFTARAPDAALFWLVIIVGCALASPAASTHRGIWIVAGTIVLIVAVVEMAHAMAFHDELTGLPGRRALAQTLNALRAPYAVAIVDIDHFKSFNDQHGHDVGDQVLRMVAARLRAVGGGGRAFRSGGEEFTLVFPGLQKREALPHLETVREAVANARFALRKWPRPVGGMGEKRRGQGDGDSEHLQVTISVGVAGGSAENAETAEMLLQSADQAMYKAKSAGRNRVMA